MIGSSVCLFRFIFWSFPGPDSLQFAFETTQGGDVNHYQRVGDRFRLRLNVDPSSD